MGDASKRMAAQAVAEVVTAAGSALRGDIELTYEEFCAMARRSGCRPAEVLRVAEEGQATLLAIPD